MNQTLKVTSILSDPTRYNIYQYMLKKHKEVNVAEIAGEFDIHPNVARLHLSKLEDIQLVTSYSKKTGKGGRPNKVYFLSNKVIELTFPYRDYKLLSSILIDSLAEMGDIGRKTLYTIGEKYGKNIMDGVHAKNLSTEQKLNILEEASTMMGLYSNFFCNEEKHTIKFQVNNCPFGELAAKNQPLICDMHYAFIKGMLEVLFTEVELIEEENMFAHRCDSCSYSANLLANY